MTSQTRPKKNKAGRPVDPVAQAARIEQIMLGARTCIVRDGIRGARIARIAREAGVSEANIYQYFSSKDDLILAIIDLDLEADLKLFKNMIEVGDIFDAFGLVLAVMNPSDETPALRTELLAAASHDVRIAQRISEAEAKGVAAFARVLRSAQAKGEIRTDLDATRAATLMLSLTDGWYARLASGIGDFDAMRPAFIDFVRHYLLADPDRLDEPHRRTRK